MTHAKRNAWTIAGVVLLAGLALGALAPDEASAHFFLMSPANWREQNIAGDPQKDGPCGNDPRGGPETGIVTPYSAGETITVRLSETVHHDGHFRVALAVNDRGELPDPPPVTPTMPMARDCDSVPIDETPDFPVLADGVLPHTEPLGETSFEVTLPSDVECEHCTLQIIQWMRNHGAPCFYYHCADISITGAAMTDGGPGSDGGNVDRDGGSASRDGGPRRDSGTASRTDSGAGSVDDVDGGCGCTTGGSDGGERALGAVGLLALGLVLRRVRVIKPRTTGR